MIYLSVIFRLGLSCHLWAGCFLFFTPAPLTRVCSVPTVHTITCRSCLLVWVSHLVWTFDIHFRSFPPQPQIHLCSSLPPTHERSLKQQSHEDKYWSVGGGGGDQDRMQPKGLTVIHVAGVIGSLWVGINIKNVREILNLSLRKRRECETPEWLAR